MGANELDVDVESIINKASTGCLEKKALMALCDKAKAVIMSQSMLLELTGDNDTCIVPDIFGDMELLLSIVHSHLADRGDASELVFLGNYVGFGARSVDVMSLLLAYKVKFPLRFHLLRGRQECRSLARVCGFYDECCRWDGIDLWHKFLDVFDCLPVCGLILGKILCVHGGLALNLAGMDAIRSLERPSDVPDCGILCDLLWSRPDGEISGWTYRDYQAMEPMACRSFGADVVESFARQHDVDLIVRAMSQPYDGCSHHFFCDRRLVSLKKGCVAHVSPEFMVSFKIHTRGHARSHMDFCDASLGVQFSTLLDAESFSDVTLKVGGCEIRAHRFVLAARSPVFKTLLSSGMVEQQTRTIEIKDLQPATVRHMVRFMYTGKLDAAFERDCDPLGLFEAAHRYDIAALEELCIALITEKLDVQSVAKYLMAFDQMGFDRIRKRCLTFICKSQYNIAQVQATAAFAELTRKRPQLLADILAEVVPPAKRPHFGEQ